MGIAFGIGSPGNFAQQPTPWGYGPIAGQGVGTYPFTPQQYGQSLQQLVQAWQAVPYQLQRVLELQYIQQSQIQQLLQLVPTQLQQIQHLIQFLPQQILQLQQGPLQQIAQGVPGLPFTSAIGGAFGTPFMPLSPLAAPFAGQQTQVM